MRQLRVATLEETLRYGRAGCDRRRLLPAVAGAAGVTLLAHTAISSGGGTTAGPTAAIDTTGATLLAMAVSTTGGGTVTVTDSQGGGANVWTAVSAAGSAPYLEFFVCTSPTHVGAGHTFSLSSTATSSPLCVAAFSGTLAGTTVDVNTGANQASGATFQPGAGTPAQDGELLLTSMFEPVGAASAVDSGFAITDEVLFSSGVTFGLSLAYLVQPTAAAVNPTWTNSGGFVLGVQMISIKAAAAAPAGPSRPVVVRQAVQRSLVR